MEGNVAVHEPRPWIVGLEGDDSKPSLRVRARTIGNDDDVTAWWIVDVGVETVRTKITILLLDDCKVMPVEVNLRDVVVRVEIRSGS